VLDRETEEWLDGFALASPVAVGDIEVCLTVFPTGAILDACVFRDCTDAQLLDALRMGFRGALEFEAGYSVSRDSAALHLSQWLPGVGGWLEAAEPLERILNQVDTIRAGVNPLPPKATIDPLQLREEHRMRMKLSRRGG
jgi:hypothetical protein